MPEIEWIDGYPTHFVGADNGPPDGEVERIVVHTGKAKAAVAVYAGAVYNRAVGYHATRQSDSNSTNRSSIIWEKPGDLPLTRSGMATTDHRIHLAVNTGGDSNPFVAARAIEYGHEGRGYGPPQFQELGVIYGAKWILHDAGGLRRGGSSAMGG